MAFELEDIKIDAVVDAWHQKKIKNKARKEAERSLAADKFDRNNINLPLIVEEKRSVIMADPDGPGQSISNAMNLETKETTVLTMKRVSSLGLV